LTGSAPALAARRRALEGRRYARLLAARALEALGWGSQREPEATWLVGERRGLSAEDTGYHFFRYCREHHPGRPIYFVCRRNAKGREAAEALGNVLDYGSVRAARMALRARAFFYSDCCQDFIHDWPRIAPHLRADARFVFLQHGVIGLSGMGRFYERSEMQRRSERLDLFVASSPRERDLIVEQLGHAREEVLLSGLSRFDSLRQAPPPRPELLVAPTFRPWLRAASAEAMRRSEYFQRWQGLLDDRRLHRILERHDLRLHFAPHFAMGAHLRLFRASHARIRILDLDSEPLHRWIRRAALAITDYSSLSFDLALLERPVLYHPFDAARFHESRGARLLGEDELPGPLLESRGALLEALESHARTGFVLREPYLGRARALVGGPGGSSSERIFEAIEARLER